MIQAEQNGRTIPKEDKVFGISSRAKAMIAEEGADKVVNATIGALLDDDGKLVVLSSVIDALKNIEPEDYAEYAPIGGIPEFKDAVKKAAFYSFEPENSFVEVVGTPGGTGAIRAVVGNYSKIGDTILTSDWCWANYKSIADEIGRTLTTFRMLDENDKFDAASLSEKLDEIMAKQDSLTLIINTPAHNPTGYSLTDEDWDNMLETLKKTAEKGKRITLFVDVAYIDFAGDPEEKRSFLPKIDNLPENILPVIGYSTSKTFTLYGMRCGAAICLAGTKEIADEFKMVCQYSARASWSNSPRAAQKVIANVYENEELLKRVDLERAKYVDLLERRGTAFDEEAAKIGLKTVPYDSGFFTSIPCSNPDEVAARLEKRGIFIVPLAKGLRVSVASISEEKCRMLPAIIKEEMDK